jgi:poly-gamma-glutamate capsule biosynthesis protein CapA/YwtB (metallophosphatase superfamily)
MRNLLASRCRQRNTLASVGQVVTFLAVGDIALRNDSPETQLAGVAPILRSGDVTFGQLETALSNRGTRQLHPGFRGRSGEIEKNPHTGAAILAEAGFDVLSFAGNHTLDRGPNALHDTINAVAEKNMSVVGAGKNLATARQPAIVDVEGTRIGVLAYCSVTPKGFAATATRPGVAPLRARTFYEQVDWQPGTPPRIVTTTWPEDLAMLKEDVTRLRPEVDVLVVSAHWGIHFEPGTIADYQYEAAHAAVDAGADLVIGHHAHVVKGVEYYKGRPICHSIGNLTLLPRGDQGEPLTPGNRVDAQFTMVLRVEITDKRIDRLSIIPCWLDERVTPEQIPTGDPRIAEYVAFLRRISTLPSTPRNAWEALYVTPNPHAKALRDTRFVPRDGVIDVLDPKPSPHGGDNA